jgi:hypothetical protein
VNETVNELLASSEKKTVPTTATPSAPPNCCGGVN